MSVGAAVVVVALALAFVAGRAGPRASADINNATPVDGYTYSAKFLCGTISGGTGPLGDGEYATAINVHNLHDFTVGIYKKAVLAPREPDVGVPSAYIELDIPPDAAFEIDCPDIQTLLGDPITGFAKGFAVIASPVELDVWGVYTSGQTLNGTTAGTGISEDIEVVAYTVQPFPPPTCTDADGDSGCDDPTGDQDDDGCTAVEEADFVTAGLGPFSDAVWYDVFDVQIPAKDDLVDGIGPDTPVGANGPRNKVVDIGDALAVLFYALRTRAVGSTVTAWPTTRSRAWTGPATRSTTSRRRCTIYRRAGSTTARRVRALRPVRPTSSSTSATRWWR